MIDGELYIGGQWRAGAGEALSSLDPAREETVWAGPGASAGDVADAFAAARAAFASWSIAPFEERKAVVERFGALLAERRDELATLISRETGKPLWEASEEAGAMAAKIAVSLKSHEARTGVSKAEAAFGRSVLRHKPNGVMAVFGPYNFPGHLPNGHIVPALIAGAAVVFKPSELTPAVGQRMVELWSEAGAPAGVVNLVQGGPDVGAAMLNDREVDGVLFTGSARVGQIIHEHFAGRPEVILALEMGGNNPLVVWDAADAKKAASLIVQSAYVTTGQRCSCARRLIVPRGSAGDAIVEAVAARTRKMRIGAGDEQPEPFMGPLVTAAAARGVIEAQSSLVGAGAEAVLEAQPIDARSAAFVTPGLLELGEVRAPDEEVFGPLLQVLRADDFDNAMRIANDTRYGLAAGLISDDEALWDRFIAGVRAGIVNWNRPTTGAASNMPFGGPGLSGNHRPGAWYAADYCA
ncbi:MAG: succinylglutamate-semialdehyde dehydrogenase, partial [Maricaulaceae bacterium]